jgi:4'-phosphopantetheinyl transferase
MFRADEFEVVVARLDAPPDEIRKLHASLAPEERERAARFFFPRHRRRYIAARGLLRRLLGERLGLRPEEVRLVYGKNGKPLVDPSVAHGGLHFSVSHSDDVALFAFSRACELGADIEALRAIRSADAIAAHVFSRREKRAYAAARDKALAFLRCWTRKEALAKGIGAGLSIEPRRLDPEAAPGWRVHSFFPLHGFIAAVACHHG